MDFDISFIVCNCSLLSDNNSFLKTPLEKSISLDCVSLGTMVDNASPSVQI